MPMSQFWNHDYVRLRDQEMGDDPGLPGRALVIKGPCQWKREWREIRAVKENSVECSFCYKNKARNPGNIY